MPGHIIIKLFKICDKEETFKAARGTKTKTTDFLSKIKQSRWPWMTIFKALKEITTLGQPTLFYAVKISFENEGGNEAVFRHMQADRIHHHQTYCSMWNVKGSPPGKRKIIPNGNLDLHRGMKSNRNDNTLEIYVRFCYYLNLFKR